MRYANESGRTWAALGLCTAAGIAALALHTQYLAHNSWRGGLISVAMLTVCVAWLLLGRFRFRELNRTLGQICADIRSGKQAPSTRLQKFCMVFALVLIVCLTVMQYSA